MVGAWLLLASGIHHADNYWLPVCSDKQQHAGPPFPSHCVILAPSFLLCSPEVWEGRKAEPPPTGSSLFTLGFLLIPQEGRRSNSILIRKVEGHTFFSLLDTSNPLDSLNTGGSFLTDIWNFWLGIISNIENIQPVLLKICNAPVCLKCVCCLKPFFHVPEQP